MRLFFVVLVFLFSLFVPGRTNAQELYAGLGITLAEQYISPTVIDLDSLQVFENNTFDNHRAFPLMVRLEFPLSPNLHLATGFQYRLTFLSLGVNTMLNDPLGPVQKVTVVGLPTFEFPVSLYYQLPFTQKLKIRLFGGLMPVVNRVRFSTHHKARPNSPDWTPAVADALNAAPSIPKKAYLNSHYGLQFSYWRLALEGYVHHTLSRSLSNGYTFRGESYAFSRKAFSVRVGLSYRVWKRKAD